MSLNVENIKVRAVNASFDGVDLGYLEGDVEIKISETTKDITAHQTGEQVLSNIRTAINVEVSLVLKETSPAQLKAALEHAGSTVTPDGVGATPLTGLGSAKLGTSTFANAKTLVLHEVLSDVMDKSTDWNFWKAYPVLESIKFSGTETQNIPLTFKCYRDTTKPAGIDVCGFGDGSQAGLVGGTFASGTIAFASQPVADDTITINGVAITFKASGAAGNQVNIGASKEATAANLLAFLTASVNGSLTVASYAIFDAVVMITYKTAGVGGNAFTLAVSDDFAVLSGAALAGGS